MEKKRRWIGYQATNDVKRSRWIWTVTLAIPALILILGLIMMLYLNMLQSR